jgi:chemotaxis protein MotB
MVVEMSSSVLFPTGSAELSEMGRVTLSELAAVLMGIADRNFQVAGHTDNVPISSGRYDDNWELSTGRALTVVRFLQEVGVDPTRLAAVGYGEYQPVAENTTEYGKEQNRRIEIVLMPNLDELPDLSALESEMGQ